MKVSYKWLKSFVDITLDPEELAKILTMQGVTVDEVDAVKSPLEGVVVGKVEEVSKHPNADRLTLCKVSTGNHVHDVVCGAPNVTEGEKYPFAAVGAILPDGTRIKKTKIRGEKSEGMLLSGYELGISDDRDGLLKLGEDIRVGGSLNDLIDLDDFVFLLDVTANRMDLLSHLGVAREVGAIEGQKVRLEEVVLEESSKVFEYSASVEIIDPEGCPRYMARIIEGIKIGPSPRWLADRLASIGQRSINNIVDVTNFVLYELGTPLHAFDLDRLEGRKIIVKRAGDGEVMRTLDGEDRVLTSEMTVIADTAKTVAIAGVMGGEDSEVTDGTVNILIECAFFDPVRIRKTSRSLGIESESSFRFERWVDPTILPYALDRAAYLMKKAAGGEILKGRGDVYPVPVKPATITLRAERVLKILGQTVSEVEVGQLLESVGFKVGGTGTFEVEVPVFRARDVTREIDLIEEVARLKGYDWIDTDYKCGVRIFGKIDPLGRLERQIGDFLLRNSFLEVISTSFVSSDIACSLLGFEETRVIQVENPVNTEQRFMRPLLLAAMLPVLASNVRKRNRDVRIFEQGKVFLANGTSGGEHLEERHVAFAVAGSLEPLYWKEKSADWDYHSFKGVVERFLAKFLPGAAFSSDGPAFLHGTLSRTITLESKEIGFFGQLEPGAAGSLEIEDDVYVFEVSGEVIVPRIDGSVHRTISRFPPLERDLSLVVPEEVPYSEVERLIRKEAGELLDELCLFDLYRGGQITEGQKGMSFSLIFRSAERTLEDPEINPVIDVILESLRKELNIVLR